MQVENARFQRNARGVFGWRHVPGCNDLRSLSMAEKNADREDFRGANHHREDNGRNRSVRPSIEGNGLCTIYYIPTDSRSYLLYSSSHPSHVKNSKPSSVSQTSSFM